MNARDEIRTEVCRYAKRMVAEGMVVGTAGNVSARVPAEELVALTPSSVLAVLGRPLPPVVEELVPYVGGQVDVAAFAMSGSDELAANVVSALGDKAAAFLANHGNLCCGKTLAKTLRVAQLVERCAEIYVTALRVGDPKPLAAEVLEREQMMYDALRNWG
jgi:L-fuculose-phosphate aldolase